MQPHPYLRCYAASLFKAATFQDMGRKADAGIKNIGQLSVAPLSTGGSALVGGTAGVAAGGLVGLLRAALDSEDDDLGSTARKALHDGFIGGAGGAALGMTGAKLKRDSMLDKVESQQKEKGLALGPEGSQNMRKVLDQVLRRVEVPVVPATKRMLGGDPKEFQKAVGETNNREVGLRMMASLLAPHLAKGKAPEATA